MSDTWFFDALPCRPAPYEDECLSGYLLRLAATNGMRNIRAFVQALFPTWPEKRQVNILRWEYPVDNWDELSRRTQLSVERLDRMTLHPWVAKFRVRPMESEGRLLRPGQMLRDIVRPTLQVCPLCLQEKPYWRLLWRLQLVTACVKHGCRLQDTCHACGQQLSVVSSYQQHLHCGHCGNDLRQLPILAASDEMLAKEARRQPDWEYLLDPAASLINENEASTDCGLPRVIGLKLRYLRYQTGLSPVELGQQIEPSASQIKTMEHGWQKRQVSLVAYLTYLEGLGYSWRSFANLNVPPEFFSTQLQPQYMSLRICPTVDCPNHQPPPGTGVILRRHFPERGILVLKCKACKRKFTRTYAGRLVTKYRRPLSPSETQVTVHKPAEEIEQVRQLGLQGRSARYITKCLGWGKETVRNCWQSLDIAAEVQTAQKQRQQQKSQKHREALLGEVEQVLDCLCQQDARITFVGITRALGRRDTYIFRYPDIANRVREVAAQHDVRRKQRRIEELQKKISQVIIECHENDTVMSIRYIAEQAGSTAGLLQYHHPELWDMIRQAVAADKEQRKARRFVRQCQHINEAATRLATQNIRLTKSAIIEEARKCVPITSTNPQVKELLDKWLGDLGSSD
ncbi:MAG: TniQ family protein [Gammaproteobacteria bacterium]|nr:TniQ family protein [Gammaproteobacteria bacterium]